jgi:hypothetical protein
MGAIYVMVSETVNTITLPGLAIYTPPPGLPWSALIGAAIGLLMGLAISWSSSFLGGIFLGSLAGALVVSAYTLTQAAGSAPSLAAVGEVLLVIFAPIAALLAGMILIFRIALDRQQVAIRNQQAILLRAGIPLLLILLAVGAGWSRQYPPHARLVLERTQDLIAKGLVAAGPADLPEPLQDREVNEFLLNAAQDYSLQWERETTNRYRIARPANTEGRESLVIARFANGWMLVCLYPRPEWDPRCKSFWQNDAP